MKPLTARMAVLALAIAIGGCDRTKDGDELPDDYVSVVQAWRDKHEADYRREWVTVAALHFLDPGSHRIGSAPDNDIVLPAGAPARAGRLTVVDDSVTFEPEPGITAMRDERLLTGAIVLKERGQRPAGEVVIGQLRLVIHVPGGRLALRVRDPDSEVAKSFKGFAWFPIDPSYRVEARFIRDSSPRQFSVLNTLNGVDTYSSEGVAEFELQGRTLRLRPFTTRPGRLYFVFRDASAGVETYKTARFLYSDLRGDGTTILDFNQGYNPPCAFNPYTTCPIPLRENVLPVKVLAGERAYQGNAP